MTSNEILKADVLDILFDNRNKQYGAYALRKKYNNRLSMALGISLSAALLLFVLLPVNHSKKILAGINYSDSVVLKIIDLPKDIKKIIPPPKPKEIVQQQVRQKQFVTMIISNKKEIIPPPDIRDLLNTDISNKTLDGRPSTGIAIVQSPVVPSTGSGEQKIVSEFKPEQKEPEFPGGAEAWLKFLRKNLIAPEELGPGEKKMVSIKFFVAKDGSVTGFEVLQSAGKSFDNEVIRVLKRMPKWKPAIQNGQPVEKAFTQPVTFVGVEE